MVPLASQNTHPSQRTSLVPSGTYHPSAARPGKHRNGTGSADRRARSTKQRPFLGHLSPHKGHQRLRRRIPCKTRPQTLKKTHHRPRTRPFASHRRTSPATDLCSTEHPPRRRQNDPFSAPRRDAAPTIGFSIENQHKIGFSAPKKRH